MTLEDLQKQAYVTTLPDVAPADVNLTTGLADYWIRHKDELGTPLTKEIDLDDGRVAQRFATGRILVFDAGMIEVV